MSWPKPHAPERHLSLILRSWRTRDSTVSPGSLCKWFTVFTMKRMCHLCSRVAFQLSLSSCAFLVYAKEPVLVPVRVAIHRSPATLGFGFVLVRWTGLSEHGTVWLDTSFRLSTSFSMRGSLGKVPPTLFTGLLAPLYSCSSSYGAKACF